MEYVIMNECQVFTREEVATEKQTAEIFNFFSMILNTKIEKRNDKIIIKMFNYLDEFQEDYTGEIKFKVGEEEFTDVMKNGILEFEFVNETGKPVTIETLNENIRNGVLVIE